MSPHPLTAGADVDAQLVARARAGERAAFEELVRRHADRLHAVVLGVCGDRQDAEEVTQETFVRAWRSLGHFEERSQFFTWLYRIGVNEAKRRLGSRSRAPALRSLDEEAIDVADRRRGPHARAEERDLHQALRRAILALPFEYRMPLVLRDVEGLSTAQAAAIMELGEAAFKSRLHRARQALAYCSRREHLRRTLRIALVVGLVLTAINQADVIAGGRATAGTWLKCALNFVVPFVVSNLGLLTGRPSSFGRAGSFEVPQDRPEAEPSRRRPGRSG